MRANVRHADMITIMKKFVISFITLISGLVGASGQTAATEHYFPYPMVPDNLTTLQQRCSFLVYNFWNFCDFKSAFSSLDKMEGAFADFVSFMPYASADTVEIAVTNLLDKVKKSPAHTLALARMARAHLYADSADIISEQVYLPFAQAVVANKKIPAADREPFAREAKIMANTRVGQRIPDLEFTLPDGTVSKVSQHLAPMVLLVFTGPDCSECSLDRVRLSADYALKKMMDSGRLSIINLYVGAPDRKSVV